MRVANVLTADQPVTKTEQISVPPLCAEGVASLYFELESATRLPCEYYYEAVISPFEVDD